jgi:hypothetical protein
VLACAEPPVCRSDELIDLLRPAFDAAAQGIAALGSVIGPKDAADSVLARDPGAAVAWYELTAHTETLDRIAHARRALSGCGYGVTDVPVALYIGPPTASTRTLTCELPTGPTRLPAARGVGGRH